MIEVDPRFVALCSHADLGSYQENFERFLKRRWEVEAPAWNLRPLFPHHLPKTFVRDEFEPKLLAFHDGFLSHFRDRLLIEGAALVSQLLGAEEADKIDHSILTRELGQEQSWRRRMARPDMTIGNDHSYLLEWNFGSGMLGMFEYEQAMGFCLDVPPYRAVIDDIHLEFQSPFKGLALMIDREDSGTLAVVDYCDRYNFGAALQEYLNRYRKEGKVLYAYSPELAVDGQGNCTLDGAPVKSVYINMAPNFYNDIHLADLWRGVRAGRLSTFATLFSKIVSSKAALALLYRDLQEKGLGEDMSVLARYFLPPTVLAVRGTSLWCGQEVDVGELADRMQRDLVLKTANSQAGEGTLIGRSVSTEEWRQAVNLAFDSPYPSVLQHFVDLPQTTTYWWDPERSEVSSYRCGALLSPYLFGTISGFGVRLSPPDAQAQPLVAPALGSCSINIVGLI